MMTGFSSLNYRHIGSSALFVLLFVIVSYAAHQHEEYIGLLLANGSLMGVAVFIFLTALFVIFVIPLDIVFLIPLGVGLWGPFPTALMSIAGWTLGASVAFWIARIWGMPLVVRLVGERRVTEFHDRVPKDKLFWPIVFLRILIPVDVLSYALGLFSHLSWRKYFLATLIGVAPFGFFFAYVGALPWWYQIVALAVVLTGASFILQRYGKEKLDLKY